MSSTFYIDKFKAKECVNFGQLKSGEFVDDPKR